MTERVGVVVQVRLGSTRLPNKALLGIAGQPILGRLLERLRLTKPADLVGVATSRDSAGVVALCRRAGVACVEGPEDDLLERHLLAMRAWGLTVLVRVTGDNPLTDPVGIDELIASHWRTGQALVHNKHRHGWPFGTGAELFRRELLEACDRTLERPAARAAVFATLVPPKDDPSRALALRAPVDLVRPDYFLTVDYEEDVRLMESIYGHFGGRNDMALGDVVRFLDQNPQVAAINRHLHQPFEW